MCNVVCRFTLDPKSAKEFQEKIEDEYRVNMYVCNGQKKISLIMLDIL